MACESSPSSSPVVHVVDDDDSFRRATGRLLKAAGYSVKGYATAAEFLLAIPVDIPGCVLLDIDLPGLSGLDLQTAMLKQDASLPIIFLTGQGDIPMTVRAMKAGAVDFLTKPVPRKVLLQAVETALRQDEEQRKARARYCECRVRFEALSPREREVFARVTQGMLNKQIASALGITERTVKAHRASIMEKMQVRSLAELVQNALDLRGL